jgi:RND family efflux transporter MFP subunit
MKLLISLAVVAGLGVGGYLFYTRSPSPATDTEHAGHPTTAVVESRDIQFAVTAAGDVGPADQVSVRSEINGRIEELPVDIGDKVKRGDLLCRLDDRDLQIERSQRLTEIDGARLQLQKATRNFGRSKQLFGEKLISQEVFDDSRTEFDLATNALDRAEQGLRLVDDKLRKTRIIAPFDCTVLTRSTSLGQTVSGSAGFNSGTEIMTIANLNDMVVNAHVNQTDVVRLSQGQEVEIQVESVPGLRMNGQVERLAPQAVIKNGIKGFAARVAIKNIDPRVRPGMTAVLSIPVSSADNVLAVPLAAVFTEGGERFVFVKVEERLERRPIVIGVTDYSHAEVVKGLTEGEVVSLDQTVNTAAARASALASANASTSGNGKKTAAREGTGNSEGRRAANAANSASAANVGSAAPVAPPGVGSGNGSSAPRPTPVSAPNTARPPSRPAGT